MLCCLSNHSSETSKHCRLLPLIWFPTKLDSKILLLMIPGISIKEHRETDLAENAPCKLASIVQKGSLQSAVAINNLSYLYTLRE